MLDIVSMAPRMKPLTFDGVLLQPREVALSTRHLAGRWGWHRSRVQRFLKTLERASEITPITDPRSDPPSRSIYRVADKYFRGRPEPHSDPRTEPQNQRLEPEELQLGAFSQSENGKKPTRKRHTYPPEFEAFWKAYPDRDGSNPKREAGRCWNARLKEGADPSEIMAGLQRYTAWLKGKGKLGTEGVMQARRFVGPEREWQNKWAVKRQDGERVNLQQLGL